MGKPSGRAPRRGSLAITTRRPAIVCRFWGDGAVADATMATAYSELIRKSRARRRGCQSCTRRAVSLVKKGSASVKGGVRGWGGDFSSSTYRRFDHRRRRWGSPGPLTPSLGFDAARGRIRAAVGEGVNPSDVRLQDIARDTPRQHAFIGSVDPSSEGSVRRVRRRRAGRSEQRRRGPRASNARPAFPGRSAHGRARS